MEKFRITDLVSQEVIVLQYTRPSMIILFSLSNLVLVKEINKDIGSSILEPVGIFIGTESKKIQLWQSKEPNCMKLYFGGTDLKEWKKYNVPEVPFFFLINNNEIIFSKSFSSLAKPFISSMLKQFPEFRMAKSSSPTKIEFSSEIDKDPITREEEVKFSSIEKINSESHDEIEILKKDLEEKDKLINQILEKM